MKFNIKNMIFVYKYWKKYKIAEDCYVTLLKIREESDPKLSFFLGEAKENLWELKDRYQKKISRMNND